MNGARYELPDLVAMADFGARIADRLKEGDVVALSGGLGAGKTTLARGILSALGHEGDVPSPTFTIIETYEAPTMLLPVVHADFYRLEHPSELEEIGLDDYREGAALIAEWPDHAGGFAHEAACLEIELQRRQSTEDQTRIAIARGGKDWLGRMP
ncbi:MAG: tRNA (adenosine(37)-N6)-threonylcarbamoyltransferase complex ATPase subunit type 1 TsaE [Pseudomonadota bacterium]